MHAPQSTRLPSVGAQEAWLLATLHELRGISEAAQRRQAREDAILASLELQVLKPGFSSSSKKIDQSIPDFAADGVCSALLGAEDRLVGHLKALGDALEVSLADLGADHERSARTGRRRRPVIPGNSNSNTRHSHSRGNGNTTKNHHEASARIHTNSTESDSHLQPANHKHQRASSHSLTKTLQHTDSSAMEPWSEGAMLQQPQAYARQVSTGSRHAGTASSARHTGPVSQPSCDRGIAQERELRAAAHEPLVGAAWLAWLRATRHGRRRAAACQCASSALRLRARSDGAAGRCFRAWAAALTKVDKALARQEPELAALASRLCRALFEELKQVKNSLASAHHLLNQLKPAAETIGPRVSWDEAA
ncbi:unnamed protein product [Polarella glacialis]|uniref:Uncharacterized protein n=1 Tax=Polarella glacialis TaxID=89957 RepID=A0A813F4E6_POLGL|nr:unnamed protein product [Polarella glacialis]